MKDEKINQDYTKFEGSKLTNNLITPIPLETTNSSVIVSVSLKSCQALYNVTVCVIDYMSSCHAHHVTLSRVTPMSQVIIVCHNEYYIETLHSGGEMKEIISIVYTTFN